MQILIEIFFVTASQVNFSSLFNYFYQIHVKIVMLSAWLLIQFSNPRCTIREVYYIRSLSATCILLHSTCDKSIFLFIYQFFSVSISFLAIHGNAESFFYSQDSVRKIFINISEGEEKKRQT